MSGHSAVAAASHFGWGFWVGLPVLAVGSYLLRWVLVSETTGLIAFGLTLVIGHSGFRALYGRPMPWWVWPFAYLLIVPVAFLALSSELGVPALVAGVLAMVAVRQPGPASAASSS